MCYTISMKKMVLLVVLLLPVLAYAAPSLKFENESHDFGQAKEGERLEYTFEFSNTGKDDLSIEKVNAP